VTYNETVNSVPHNSILIIAALLAVLVEAGILLALGYGALRFATKVLRTMRDIEEIKIAIHELQKKQ
jgi:hypothetical protein